MDSIVLDLLEEAAAAGLQVSADGDLLRIRGPKTATAIVSQLVERKPEILAKLSDEREQAIQLRVAVFRLQIPLTGPVPFLAVNPSITPDTCLSCGELVESEFRTRCDLCADAARRAIAEVEALRKSSRDAS